VISVRKLILATIFLLILFLFACQENESDLEFVGEGGNWSSKVTVNQTNGDETYQIQINYKGQCIQEIEAFSYSVETKSNGIFNFSENNISLNKEGVYQKNLPISNSSSANVKDELVIKVEWNGNSENFMILNE